MSVGSRIAHDSAREHVSGQSIFIDDRPLVAGEVFVDVVGSPVSAGVLEAIDSSEALKIPGVLAVFTAADLKHNYWGTIKQDQPLLVADKIGYHNEPLCILAAESRESLLLAKKTVAFKIKELPAILSLEDAVAKKDFLYTPKALIRGDAIRALATSPHRLSGSIRIGGQEHFYLETQAAIAYPLESGQLEIHSSSQHPSEAQHLVAKALGLNYSDVVSIVKRMGGAFGGKESQAGPFAVYAALVASRLKRPARMVLLQEEDFRITGKRHPFLNYYEVGFDDKGKILALKLKLYANGGAYTDLSPSIFDRAMAHSDGAYFIENILVEGSVCRTNQHSNTAFRGFGGPQGNLTTENILEEIAIFLKKDAAALRRLNVYGEKDRNITPYGQVVQNNLLPKIFDQILKTSDYEERKNQIAAWNQSQRGSLKGISLGAVKFGIAFTARFLNQGSAQVNIHLDGTVQVSTGATEMGQGVNTKIAQIVAQNFGISVSEIRVMPTSTEKNPNTSPTAASSGADINGAAADKACRTLRERLAWVFDHSQRQDFVEGEIPSFVPGQVLLEQFKYLDRSVLDTKSGAKIEWKSLLNIAYRNRVSLGEFAFYKTEELRENSPFRYFTSGAAVSEVEIDEYTGQLKVIRVDLLMDLGRPINPGIDLGQVTGGFVQGMGWITTENLFYREDGKLLSSSPTTYKIPNIQDTPRIFKIDLIENPEHDQAIARSKAVGEPPLLLGTSVFTAVKNALSYRAQGKIPQLSAPLVPELVLMELSSYEQP